MTAWKSLLIGAALTLLGAQFAAAADFSRASSSGGYLALSELAQQCGLKLESDPGCGRLQLRGDCGAVALAVGVRFASVNGKAADMGAAPRVVGGILQVPATLPGLLGKKKAGGAVRGTVILDPGHGGKDPGAVANGLAEKSVVLDVARRLKSDLEARGAEVLLTRSDDTFLSLEERSRIANRHPDAVFVSIHANSTDNPSVSGVETFVLASKITESYRVNQASSRYDLEHARGGTMSQAAEKNAIASMSRDARAGAKVLASLLQRTLVAGLKENDRSVQAKNLAVLRETYFCPAVLVEIGFITNHRTASLFKTADYREKIAQCMCDAIAKYLAEN